MRGFSLDSHSTLGDPSLSTQTDDEVNVQSVGLGKAGKEHFLVLDANLCVKAASDSFYTTFRITPGQAIGEKLADLGNGDWSIPIPSMDAMELEMDLDVVSVGRRTMLVSVRPLSGLAAESAMFLLSIRDSAEQKRIEVEADNVVARYASALANIGEAVIVTDLESRITLMNPPAEKLTGWGFKDASQKQLAEVFRIVDEQSSQTLENPVTRAIRDGVIIGLASHTVLIARDDIQRPIDDSAAPILNAAGRIIGVVLVFHDVTDRRKVARELESSELRYRRLFESAHDGILILDAGTAKVIDVNPFMTRLLGYPPEHFLGKELWEMPKPPKSRWRSCRTPVKSAMRIFR
jgi:PAS domain S-box-containing protein